MWPTPSSRRRWHGRNRAARTSEPIFPPGTTSASSATRWCTATPTTPAAWSICRLRSRAGLRASGSTESETTMADTVTLQVTRYRPEVEAEPVVQEYRVPRNKDWVILDALNYIKDSLDGTLTFRWSCRMGICGSCGMMVNGEPKLTCATFLIDYPGPIRVEPLGN